MTKTVLTVLGARPQFIKASVISAAIAQTPQLSEVVVHTGQHFDSNMSDIFFRDLGMEKPAHSLNIHGGSHGDMTGRMLVALERTIQQVRPDLVMVYGDTNSTLAGALAAVKQHIPVAHVEAGLRSFNLRMPEEVNRILTDRVSRWLFTPTEAATAHLLSEGTNSANIFEVGDVMLDVALHHGSRVDDQNGIMQELGLKARSFILATIHRAENTDDPQRLAAIFRALTEASKDIPIVWPLHPRTRNLLDQAGLLSTVVTTITLTDPIGYIDMVQLEKYARLIITDSGGVQKEAFFHRVPCITLRDETEWVELVEAGWNHLVPPASAHEITTTIARALSSTPREIQPYGSGNAAQRIVANLSA